MHSLYWETFHKMALEIKQGLNTTQRLSLSVELKHSITILSLGRQDLERFISDELEKNPCLEDFSKTDSHNPKKAIEELKQTLQSSYNQNDYLERYNDIKKSESLSFENYKLELADSSSDFSLHAHLHNEIATMRLSPYEFECTQTLLQYIDDNGILNSTLESIAEIHSIHLDDLKFALETIQKCEPTGVGAQNIQECLLLQAEKFDKKPKFVKKILEKHWNEFQKQNFQKIAKIEKTNIEEIKESFRFIRTNLDPKPTRQFGFHTDQTIIPDIYVFKRNNEWICSLNENGLPRIKLSKKYEAIAKEIKKISENKETYKYINENLKSAKWLVKSLREREKTILKVADVILHHQKDFFDFGVEHLTPITLKVIAEELNLHESTISRATSGKYMYSPRGIFELKYFFNTSIENNSGKELANESIKQWVFEYIKNEDKLNPLSDQELSNLIAQEKQLKIARRTISKYRESLGILSSSKRTNKF